MDLTVLATPLFLGTMALERAWLVARKNQPQFTAGQYERQDTVGNLTMGTASLLTPLLAGPLRKQLGWGGKASKPLAALAVAGLATTAVLDRRSRRQRRAGETVAAEHTEEQAGIAAAVGLGSTLVLASTTWATRTAATRLWDRRRFDLGRGVLGWTAALVGWDFLYYWNHRFMHESRYMWAIHVVHHSSERYNLSVAVRQPVADLFGTFVPYGLLSWLGVAPDMVETSRALNLIYQYWIHTEAIGDLGAAEAVLNTPALHRVHHGTALKSIDRNHGGVLITWDRLFGTHQPEEEQQVYGLTTNIKTFNPLRIASHEYQAIVEDVRSARTWHDRVSSILRGPGWALARRAAAV
jgi:sterol desaturase/sphingolipid hydroxylase (fatty acid hydroxylase superfamily)